MIVIVNAQGAFIHEADLSFLPVCQAIFGDLAACV